MERDVSSVSAPLGLGGFVVPAQLFDEVSGEWWLAVERTEDPTWYESCGDDGRGARSRPAPRRSPRPPRRPPPQSGWTRPRSSLGLRSTPPCW
jgi:hypothetical protein